MTEQNTEGGDMNNHDRKAWMELGEILEPIALRGWVAYVHFYSCEPPAGERLIEFSADHLSRCDKGTFTDVHIEDVEDALEKLGELCGEEYNTERAKAMVALALELNEERDVST